MEILRKFSYHSNSRRIIRVILFFNLNFLHIYHKSSIQNLDMKGYVSALIPTATIEEFLEIFLAWLFAGMAIIVTYKW